MNAGNSLDSGFMAVHSFVTTGAKFLSGYHKETRKQQGDVPSSNSNTQLPVFYFPKHLKPIYASKSSFSTLSISISHVSSILKRHSVETPLGTSSSMVN